MADISPAMIKTLRERTGAGMLDCKKALDACGGNEQEAVDWLRKKGLAAAAKKSGRAASEGLVGVAVAGDKGVLVEVNSETDFVSRNEKFQHLVKNITQIALQKDAELEALKNAAYPGTGRTVQEEVTEAVAVIGENIQLRRSAHVTGEIIISYLHNNVTPELGKIGVLVALKSQGNAEKVKTLGKQIAMHVAASKPESLTAESLDPALIKREREIFAEQAKASGKPDNIIEKMVEGRIRKFYGEVVLLEQPFVMDGKTAVKDVIAQVAKEIGAPVEVTAFARLTLGEGVEKKEENFADEVAAVAGSFK